MRKRWQQFLVESLGGKCVRCGTTIELEINHKIALELGGPDELSNLQVLCLICHKKKHGTEKIYINLDEDEERALDYLNEHSGIRKPQIIRMALRRHFAQEGFLSEDVRRVFGIDPEKKALGINGQEKKGPGVNGEAKNEDA